MEYQILMLFKALRIIKIFDYITLLGCLLYTSDAADDRIRV